MIKGLLQISLFRRMFFKIELRRKSYLLFFFILLPVSFQAQVSDYARAVVDSLASDQFKGRGYVDNGDKIAADYIRQEFNKHGLKSFTKNYTQSFRTPVNTFPYPQMLKINGKELRAGFDYLIDAGSPTLKGAYEVIILSAEDLLSDELLVPVLQHAAGKVIVIEAHNKNNFSKEEQERIQGITGFLKYHENNPAAATIVLTNEKLTWSGSTTTFPNPSFTIRTNSITNPIKKVEFEVRNKFHKRYKTQNLIGYVEGENTDSIIVFIAHYDHLGMRGLMPSLTVPMTMQAV